MGTLGTFFLQFSHYLYVLQLLLRCLDTFVANTHSPARARNIERKEPTQIKTTRATSAKTNTSAQLKNKTQLTVDEVGPGH